MFKHFTEIKEIAKEGRKAVCAMVSIGGVQIEAWRNDEKAFVEMMDKGVTIQSEITIDQFINLSKECDWDMCGAQSANDAVILEAAMSWMDGENLNWQRKTSNGHMVSSEPNE
ncbi:MAG: hypothetical protein ABW166_18155 [Sedimenticola sp.]